MWHRRRPQSKQSWSRPLRRVVLSIETIIPVPDMNAFVRFATSPSTCPAVIDSALRIPDATGRKPVLTVPVNTPPATWGTLGCEPLKAAMRGADRNLL